MIDTTSIRQAIQALNAGITLLEKKAFVPAPPPQGPATGAPIPPQGPPPGPVDPNTGMPIDPNTDAPMDPAAMGGAPMPPQGPPPGPAPTPQGGGISPELEAMLSEMASGMQGVTETLNNQQQIIDTLAERLAALEGKADELNNALSGPAPFEGSTKTQHTAGPEDSAMTSAPLPPPGM